MKTALKTTSKIGLAFIAIAVLAACDDDERIVEVETIVEVPAPTPVPVPYSYTVTITNLSHAQPFSPLAAVLHESGQLWAVGDVASLELERLAEGGSAVSIVGLPEALVGNMGETPIAPGDSQTLSLTVNDVSDAKLTVLTMLVNTNDAFTGLNGWDLSQLDVGESWSRNLNTYDAGTERNTETTGTIPGPADSGEGFNPSRDDSGFVSLHPGVVGIQDGLDNSVLSGIHKFDNPTARITIIRNE